MAISQLVVGAGMLCLTAFGGIGQPDSPGAAGWPPATTPVVVRLATDRKVYPRQRPVKLTFTVKNASKSPVKLVIASGMKYDFEIHKGKTAAGPKVWQWSRGRMFAQMIIQTTMEPGKQQVYAETFTPGENGPDGRAVPALEPGTYTATGVLELSGRAPRPMATTTFEVK